MMNTIINIGRSFGSGGGFVGQAIGRKLGIPVYDNELISKVAEEKGYFKNLFAHEERRSLFSVNNNMMFQIQGDVIRAIAENGDAVIIGRCADYILRDLKCLDVFVCAPLDYRINRLTEIEGLSPEDAEALIRRKDRTRETYYNYYTFGNWGQASNYDLCVDSSILGIEGTADYIIDFGRKAGIIK